MIKNLINLCLNLMRKRFSILESKRKETATFRRPDVFRLSKFKIASRFDTADDNVSDLIQLRSPKNT